MYMVSELQNRVHIRITVANGGNAGHSLPRPDHHALAINALPPLDEPGRGECRAEPALIAHRKPRCAAGISDLAPNGGFGQGEALRCGLQPVRQGVFKDVVTPPHLLVRR